MLERPNRTPISVPEAMLPALEQLLGLIADSNEPVALTTASGSVPLPPGVVQLLAEIVEALNRRSAVSVLELHQELTTNQAATILNVSRQYLVRLLDAGEIRFSRTGTHRRIRLEDVLEYRDKRDAKRDRDLTDLSQLSQDAGLYE